MVRLSPSIHERRKKKLYQILQVSQPEKNQYTDSDAVQCLKDTTKQEQSQRAEAEMKLLKANEKIAQLEKTLDETSNKLNHVEKTVNYDAIM